MKERMVAGPDRSKIASTIAMAAALGAGMGTQAAATWRPAEPKNDFRSFHDEMRELCKPRRFYPSVTTPYRRPMPKLHKGRKAVRAAKRAKVAARYGLDLNSTDKGAPAE